MTPIATPSQSRLSRWLTAEKTGGLLLLAAAALALIWANSPWREAYQTLSNTMIGWGSLRMPLAEFAADGLLAFFFLVVGLELGQELATGALSDLRQAALPVIAAVGGMAVPAVIFTIVIILSDQTAALSGWAIPTATDIAFALAVLALFGTGLPRELRIFLLTLAVVDDLLAIIVIAVFYSSGLNWLWLLGAIASVAGYAWYVRRSRVLWPVLLIAGLTAWLCMYLSGVHATIAGVAIGLATPARRVGGELLPRAKQYELRWGPVSAGLALPIFAFFAAGVTVVGELQVLGQPVVVAVMLGLIVGKLVGILGTTALLTSRTRLQLPEGIKVASLIPIALLAGIGFTVALLIGELSYTEATLEAGAKLGVLLASTIAAAAGAVALVITKRRHSQGSERSVH